jgi:rhamnose utilization protein RhaD (predicted bifunctional aldolase and dehydrogenase)
VSEFVDLCRRLGADLMYAQGGGGNASFKANGRLYVKPSGIRLADVSDDGLICLNHRPLQQFLRSLSLNDAVRERERSFDARVSRLRVGGRLAGAPSIETSLHIILPGTFVFHTHHALANVFTCMRDGERRLRDIFGDQFLFVDYHPPGLPLALGIQRALETWHGSSNVIFLKNHGVVVQDDDLAAVEGRHIRITDVLRKYLTETGAYIPLVYRTAPADFGRHLFPDSVVYSSGDVDGFTAAQRRTFYEISSVVNYIETVTARLGAVIDYLPDHAVEAILGMEKENYRVSLLAATAGPPA